MGRRALPADAWDLGGDARLREPLVGADEASGHDDLAPIVNHVLDVFGPDRAIFASDWPVCTTVATLAEWVHALQDVVRGRPEEQRRKLFHDNAVRVYGLK